MKELFPTFYRPSDDDLRALWQDCTFVFDTNVLLNLYRYPREAREDFLSLLRQIQSRVWVPHQVALEYQQNRLGVIAEQKSAFGKVRKILAATRKQLHDDLRNLQLDKRHSSINPDEFLANIGEIIECFEDELNGLENEQPGVSDNDEIRDALDALFAGRIGPPPADQGVLDQIYKDGKARYQLKRPPGYLDAGEKKEEDAYVHGGLVFRRLYGDLLLWLEMIDGAEDNPRFRKLIFVCDDQKDDWWLTVESQGRKTLGPRRELVEEIALKAGVTDFHMYRPERFLEHAKELLWTEIKEESIRQVRDVGSAREETSGASPASPEQPDTPFMVSYGPLFRPGQAHVSQRPGIRLISFEERADLAAKVFLANVEVDALNQWSPQERVARMTQAVLSQDAQVKKSYTDVPLYRDRVDEMVRKLLGL